ncbi:MAG: DUF2461 family protein, partial [Bacteroidota bacterium]|nr:DUF2461 family protein [Bacteroidota bacterium]
MAVHTTISKEAFDFLRQLEKNNNKEWFEANKKTFKKHETAVKGFYEAVKDKLNHHDEIEKMKM